MNLSLDFWVSLFVSPFTHFYLDKVFHNIEPDEVKRILNLILNVRNIVAHHEPIITWDGKRDQKDLLNIMNDLNKILKSICPLTAGWALNHNVARQLIDGKHYSCDQLGGHQIRVVIP